MKKRTCRESELGLLTAEELARALGVGPGVIYRAAARGEIPCYKVGRYRKFSLAEVLRACRGEDEPGAWGTPEG